MVNLNKGHAFTFKCKFRRCTHTDFGNKISHFFQALVFENCATNYNPLIEYNVII